MKMLDRRCALSAAASLFAATATATAASAQSPTATTSLLEKVRARALASRYLIVRTGGAFSGPGWDLLVREGLASQVFIIGEEHGIAENPKLAAALFSTLVKGGYRHLAIEISPPMGVVADAAARRGIEGMKALASDPTSRAPFIDLAEEAELAVAARGASSSSTPVIWGLDYELEADRRLIAMLKTRATARARAALDAVEADSRKTWARYAQTHNPGFIYSFGGDTNLVHTLIEAWPDPDPDSAWILRTLEQTLAINKLQMKGDGFGSNQLRSALIRENFLKHWSRAAGADRSPRVMVKMGASHLVRGRSTVETFDLGSLLPELAALNGRPSFSLLVLPGEGSKTAVFDPTRIRYAAAPPKDNYGRDLEPITRAVLDSGYTLFDLRPLRGVLDWRVNRLASPELLRVVHGFDALLVMTGSTASANLVP